MIAIKSIFSCGYELIIKHQFTTFFIKKIVQGFLMYNEFAQNIKKESEPVRQRYYTMKTH